MSRKIVIGENLSYKKITCKYIPDKYINASDFLLNADSGYSYIGGEYNYPKFRIYYRYYDRALKEDVFVDIYTYDVSTEEVYNIENFTLPSDFGIVESINTSSPLYKYIRVDETSGTNEEKFTKKIEVLNRLLTIYNPKLSLVFCNTKRQVDDLVTTLQDAGFAAEGLHGDLKQSQRDRVMNSFRNGRTQILVATDVAARGIDVDDVEAVFNYDLPQDEEYYVHRIGRTGRAGRTGVALTFIWGRETYRLKDIQRYCKTKILPRPIPSMKDVKRAKTEKIFEQLRDILDMEKLNSYKDSIEHFAAMEEISSLDVAAALLAMNIGKETAQKEEPALQFGNTGAEPGMVRFFINVGKNQGVRTNNILGAVAGESGMPGKLVGSIDIFDRYSFVEVPEEHAATVMKSMSNAKIKGRKVNMEPANQK